ncbi:Rft protein-domain-containing protein [Mycotypha africana]|uniref:Rft protein-domain-containing protein n=1 Tax=Mycotypha africana TaxID=64632 RepID=UPI0023018CDD|nr:Rft protein-domain-containing protein [Mycotypha africana]KAI8991366.1 Rft protein-domain-containing protein [Mycotypha africana]
MDLKEPISTDQQEKKATAEEGLLAATAKGASYLILLQFLSRMLTFSLNQLVLRYVSKATFGMASVNLELLASTILFISREGFRSALVRSNKSQQTLINLAYVPTVFGFFITWVTCAYYLWSLSAEENEQFPYYSLSVLLYGAASFLELMVEPLFILALNRLCYWLDRPLLTLGVTMTLQSFLKHILTEGDKMLISVQSSSQDRGIYAFVVNYGSLVEWSVGEGNAPGVLAAYCMYVPFMGINGITEGFVQAVATKSDLNRLSYFMIFFSACFMAAGYVFMHVLSWGATGLVLANMVNLGIRITYSWHFIRQYFGHRVQPMSIREWFPHASTLFAFAMAWYVTQWSQTHVGWYTFHQKVAHIGVGVLCLFMVALVM